ncbi:MAG: transposase [Candidatus Poribacteria bacterium]|nr:transposase [Candidatus Poribacteria bacterium]
MRVCKNACFYHKGQRIKLQTLKNTETYPNISYHSTEKLRLNLLVFRDANHQEPLYLVSNSLQNAQLYLTYKQRMQIEECFRDIKTLFGFRYLRLKRQELLRIALLWFIVCVSYGICFLHFEKSGEQWIKTYNTYYTYYSLDSSHVVQVNLTRVQSKVLFRCPHLSPRWGLYGQNIVAIHSAPLGLLVS